jgi:threonine synthase
MAALEETEGAAVAVSEEAILEAAGMMARTAGILPSPEGAAALAGLLKLAGSGRVGRDQSVVVFNTADWTRYRFMLAGISKKSPRTGRGL